ncbi:hypothetical protein CP8484711_1027B, partial [Chlamydia psittaci 84-8471/1]
LENCATGRSLIIKVKSSR